jgi:hypothetical protein
MIFRSYPFSKWGTPFGLGLHTSGIEPECMKLILGLVFQIGGLGVSETRVTPQHDTCQPPLRPPLPYLTMTYQGMSLNR